MAGTAIRVRSYNVGFGDCFLVSFRDAGQTWQMLIDFGNAPTSSTAVFGAIAENIRQETGSRLDVVVMTHEHLDHMSGFYSQRKVFDRCNVDYVWMGLPSRPGYYQEYPDAEPLQKLRAAARAFADHCERRQLALAPSFRTMLLNNLSNVERIDYVRNLAKPGNVLYLKRGSTVRGKPFPESFRFSVLAPEADLSVYYGNGEEHLSLYQRGLLQGGATGDPAMRRWLFNAVPREPNAVPKNLSAADWKKIREVDQTSAVDSIRAIDTARNNTSLVLLVEFAGKRLLFPGDAEAESWTIMRRKCGSRLRNIDFLKASQHGSQVGTDDELLDRLLPVSRKQLATVMVSTMSKVYGAEQPIPDEQTIRNLKRRCRRFISTDGDDRLFVDAHI